MSPWPFGRRASKRGSEASDSAFWRGMYQRRIARQSKLATQSWPEFFKGLAIETAVIAAVLVAVLIVILMVRG
ncbi:MAG TPA: hypothetical protein VIK83_03615 [Coriobacteriia bacterium]